MRLIRRLLLLAIVGVGGVAAFNYWSENGWPVRPSAAELETQIAKQQAARLAAQAAATANDAASRVGDTVSDSALTAKIKSKMVLDDEVKARGIDVDTSDTVVTLTGVVGSIDERNRAVRLARETRGVTKVIDKLRVRVS
jgi:hyperosmotically inducible periplasmic protein